MLNLAEAREWLEILHGDSPGYLSLCAMVDGKFSSQIYEPGDVDAAMNYIQRQNNRGAEGIYLRATTLRSKPEHGRGGDDLSFMLPGLWADIDLAGPGHKSKGVLPPTAEEGMRIVAESGLPQPSHWIHSGGGLYPWWLLREPAEIDDIETFRALSSGWQRIIETASKKLGYTYGAGIGDLSRVLRIPGTINRKAGLERPCTGLEGHAWSGPTYTLPELLGALEAATPPPPPPTRLEVKQTTIDGLRPGDDFEQQVSWHDLLLPQGWQWVYKRGDKWHLRRPGKNSGTSATLSDTTGNLFIFSEECQPLEAFRHYSKFAWYAYTEHHGNFSEATKDLRAKGFGTPLERTATSTGNRLLLDSCETVETAATDMGSQSQTVPHTTPELPSRPVTWRRSYSMPKATVEDFRHSEYTVKGTGDLYAQAYEDAFKYCGETGQWWFWNQQVWRKDHKARFEDGVKAIIDIGSVAAREAEIAQEPYAKALRTHVSKLANAGTPHVARWARSDERLSIEPADLDADKKLVTMPNGIFDLNTMTIMPHDPKMLLTKQIPVAYDKDATAPQWEAFVAQVLPDPDVRAYLQKALGYTLLGEAQERALFLCHGESGSGKSQFIRVMELLMGDYAETASAATFNAASKTASLTNDLNDLRGKRFVSISELDKDEALNEALIKRLTGGDTAKSRGLYQENASWRVEFTMWMATNFLPKLNSDDNAIWRRVKPVHFPYVAKDHGAEVLGLGEKLFAAEASGILNWVLEGARKYQEEGLQDLAVITEAVAAYRKEVDTVAQFMEAAVDENIIVVGPDQAIGAQQLYEMYKRQSEMNNVKPLGLRRFGQRLQSLKYDKQRVAAGYVWHGIGAGTRGMLGTMRL